MGRLFTPWQICDFNVIRLRRDKVQTIVTRKKSPFHDIFSVKWMSFRFCSRKTAALQLGYKFMFAITFNHDLGRFFWMREVGMISRQARHWVAPKPKVRSRFCCCCSIFFVFVLFSQMCRPVSFNSRRLSIFFVIVFGRCAIHQRRSGINRFRLLCARVWPRCRVDYLDFGEYSSQLFCEAKEKIKWQAKFARAT